MNYHFFLLITVLFLGTHQVFAQVEDFSDVPPDAPTPNSDAELFRFYSDSYKGHFYTVSEFERKMVQNNSAWSYEGSVYDVYTKQEENTVPVFRFWHKEYNHHFYTTSEDERNYLMTTDANWLYEGPAYFAHYKEQEGTIPVYRFYNPTSQAHFYTISEVEKSNLVNNDVNWNYEGVAWYVMRE